MYTVWVPAFAGMTVIDFVATWMLPGLPRFARNDEHVYAPATLL
jgi:hypothetical protein